MTSSRRPFRGIRLVLLVMAGITLGACQGNTEPGQTSSTTTATAGTSLPTTSPTDSTNLPTAGVLLVVGDWGSGTLPQGAVAAAMQGYASGVEVEAILTTGDNFYSDDADFLMAPYEWVETQGIAWWITWGNHDEETESRIEAVNTTFGSPPMWTVHRWGQIDVIVLDSNQVTSVEQATYFLAAMSSSNRPTIIAVHHPPYSCSHQGSTTKIVNEWVSVLDEDVVLVMSGHDHSYQRFENGGITYVVTGGGGSDLMPLTECPDNHPERLAGASLHHFVALEQGEVSIQLSVIDVNGEEVDAFSIPIP